MEDSDFMASLTLEEKLHSDGRDNFPQQAVQSADSVLQQEVLLLCVFLPLLRDLQGLHQLSVLAVQILQQRTRLPVLRQLRRKRQHIM